jgi:hypothetical protein
MEVGTMETRYFAEGRGTSTPWGSAQSSTKYARGIVGYETASHGGFHLTPAREADLDSKLREVGLTAVEARMGYEAGWYEEDCSAYAVIYAWPEFFPNTPQAEALESLTYWCRSHAERS